MKNTKTYSSALIKLCGAMFFDPSIWSLDMRTSWLVDRLVAERALTLLTGDTGAGKSTLALAIAGAVAHGAPFSWVADKAASGAVRRGREPGLRRARPTGALGN